MYHGTGHMEKAEWWKVNNENNWVRHHSTAKWNLVLNAHSSNGSILLMLHRNINK